MYLLSTLTGSAAESVGDWIGLDWIGAVSAFGACSGRRANQYQSEPRA